VDHAAATFHPNGSFTADITISLHIEGETYDYDGPEPPMCPLDPDDVQVQRIWFKLAQLSRVNIGDFTLAMYYGYVQSGKTFVQYVILWYVTFVLKKTVVHLLDNRSDSLLQNINRDYPEFRQTIRGICADLGITNPDDYMFFYGPMTKRYLALSERQGFSENPHRVKVAMNNPTQLRALLKLAPAQRQVLVRDEADVFVMDEKTKTMPLTERLDSEAVSKYLFTATPFKNFNQIGARFEHMEKIPTKPEYRGYDDHIRHITDDEEDITETLRKVLRDIPGKSVTLIHTDFTNAKHQQMANDIRRTFQGVHVHVFNSRQAGLVHPVNKMMDEIAKVDTPCVIIAGQMAGRAISFRTLKTAGAQAHLTSMIYRPAKSTDQSTLLQAMRIFGNFDFEVPPIHVYWSAKTDMEVRESFENVNQMVSHVESGLLSRECIEKAPMKRLSRKFANLDDTKRTKLDDIEFGTPDKARDWCERFLTDNERVLTDGIHRVPVSEFEYGPDMQTQTQRNTIRRQITQGLENYDTGNHVAWHAKRYRDLFSVSYRRQQPHYTVAHHTCGNPDLSGPQTHIDCVLWKEDCENASEWNDQDTLYLYQTTKRTWKAWVPERMKELYAIRHGEEDSDTD